MDLDTIMERRHSVRSYTSMVPSERDIEKVVNAASKSPSAGNLKARKVFTFRGSSRVSSALHQTWISEAPFLLVFCADDKAIKDFGERGRDLYCIQDATIAATYSMLKATELGLGTCWIGAFEEDVVKEAAGLPDHLRPVAILAVGYEK
jgi:nitroreductase